MKNEEIKSSTELTTKTIEDNNEEDSNDNNSSFYGFLQLLQSTIDGTIRMQSTNNDGDAIQSFLGRLGIIPRKRKFSFV